MPFELTTPKQISEEKVIRQEVVTAEITQHKITKFTVDLVNNLLVITDSTKEADGRTVETSTFNLPLNEQTEAFDLILQADVDKSLYDVVASRLYDVLVRHGLIPSDGSFT